MNYWWRSTDRSKWDSDDWEAYDEYQENLRGSFLESNLQTIAWNEEIYVRESDGVYRSIETGEGLYLSSLDDQEGDQ